MKKTQKFKRLIFDEDLITCCFEIGEIKSNLFSLIFTESKNIFNTSSIILERNIKKYSFKEKGYTIILFNKIFQWNILHLGLTLYQLNYVLPNLYSP